MKTMTKMIGMAAIASLLMLSACKKDEEEEEPTPTPIGLIELTGDLATQTLTADKKYLIKGQVFVRGGRVLTIEPGTVIFGDKATRGTLVVDLGGQIIANGTVDEPIVMTSSQPAGIRDRGDWGGLVMLGRANVNQIEPAIEGITPEVNFGTTNSTANDNESSGVYRYLRVEFAGIELSPNNETNSITMGGVGRGTEMEYCMVSFGGDDGFEWFGGTVNGKYFIAHAQWDDCYDVDYGYSGNVQYGLAIRYPGFADQSGSNGFECDNGPSDDDVQPYTTGTFSNFTVVGPIKAGSSISNSNFQHCLDLRRRTAVSIMNSVFTGYPRGIRFNQASVYNNYTNGVGVLDNNIMIVNNPANGFMAGSGVDAALVNAYWNANNTTIEGPSTDAMHTALGLNPDIFYGSRLPNDYPSTVNFAVTSGTLASGADFTNPKFSEPNRTGFFDAVQHIGAFGATNWTSGWAEFDPVDAAY